MVLLITVLAIHVRIKGLALQKREFINVIVYLDILVPPVPQM